jgi:RNA polymerase sigma factor (sigma-70 family)
MSRYLTPQEAGGLIERARVGDGEAWSRLVEGFLGLLAASLRPLNLSDSDIRDVTQTTWLRLAQHIDRIEDPSRVGSWLVTTARREGLRLVTQRRWVDLRLEADEDRWADDAAVEAFDRILDRERDEAVQAVFEQLPPRCKGLLTELFKDPRPAYDEISRVLRIPIGSIGPTRGRCLKKFCALAEECGLDLRAMAR